MVSMESIESDIEIAIQADTLKTLKAAHKIVKDAYGYGTNSDLVERIFVELCERYEEERTAMLDRELAKMNKELYGFGHFIERIEEEMEEGIEKRSVKNGFTARKVLGIDKQRYLAIKGNFGMKTYGIIR